MTTPDAATVEAWAKELFYAYVGSHVVPWDGEDEAVRSGWRDVSKKALTLHAQAVAAVEAEVARLRQELRSIAANTCCDRCQEAALVAQLALDRSEGFALRARGPQEK